MLIVDTMRVYSIEEKESKDTLKQLFSLIGSLSVDVPSVGL
jgi:hypothetical protein